MSGVSFSHWGDWGIFICASFSLCIKAGTTGLLSPFIKNDVLSDHCMRGRSREHSTTKQMVLMCVFYSFTYVGSAPVRWPMLYPWFLPLENCQLKGWWAGTRKALISGGPDGRKEGWKLTSTSSCPLKSEPGGRHIWSYVSDARTS